MPIAPTIVCNNILKRAFEENIDVSPMKLQKLLYFIACEYQKRTDSPLFSEPFAVWKYGPVLLSIYSTFKSYGKTPILSYAKDAKGISHIVDEKSSPTLKTSIDIIWSNFKNWNAIALSQITHQDGSAWSKAYDDDRTVIDFAEMKEDVTYEKYISFN